MNDIRQRKKRVREKKVDKYGKKKTEARNASMKQENRSHFCLAIEEPTVSPGLLLSESVDEFLS